MLASCKTDDPVVQHHTHLTWDPCVQAILLKDCDVYSYKSDLETDPFGMCHAQQGVLLTAMMKLVPLRSLS